MNLIARCTVDDGLQGGRVDNNQAVLLGVAMNFNMSGQFPATFKRLGALGTREGAVICVTELVLSQIALSLEALHTNLAKKWALARMPAKVG